MDDVCPTIGSIKDLILSMSYLVNGLRVFQSPLLLQLQWAQIMHRKAASAKLSLMPILAPLHHSHDNGEIFLRTYRGTKLTLELRRIGGSAPSSSGKPEENLFAFADLWT